MKLYTLIDFSNMMYRSLFTSNSKLYNGKMFSSKEDLNNLVVKMSKDISNVLKYFTPICVPIFVFDHPQSWRKELLKDQPVGYKGKRKRSDEIDWRSVYDYMEKFKEILEANHFLTIRVNHAEADDLFCLLKNTLYDHTEDSCIAMISSDRDVRQLLDFNERTSQFVIAINPISSNSKDMNMRGKRKIYLHPRLKEHLNHLEPLSENDFSLRLMKQNFSLSVDTRTVLELINNPTIHCEDENPDEVVISKIFCGETGDSSDSIPSIYEIIQKSGRVKRFTNSPYQKLISKLNITDVTSLLNVQDKLKGAIEEVMNTKIIIDMNKRLERQRRLVELNPLLFPKEIIAEYCTLRSPIVEAKPKMFKDATHERLLEGSDILEEVKKVETTRDVEVLRELDKYARKLDGGMNSLFS